MSKFNITKSGTYWEGGPAKLTESIVARKATTDNFASFLEGMKDAIERAKTELDMTLNESSDILNQSTAIREKKAEETEITDLDTLVDAKVKEIQKDEQEAKLKEFLKLQYKAASHIVDLKAKMKETEEMNATLKTCVESQNDKLLDKVQEIEIQKTKDDQRVNMSMTNRIKLTKLVSANPPPKFDKHKAFGTASGLLAFLNEELEDYFDDICMTEKDEKCRLILKAFGERSEDYKCTARRFFTQENIHDLIKDDRITMRMIYKELVHFTFAKKPKGEVGPRRDHESLTNYLTRWFTIKDYCGIATDNQGGKILKAIFDRPDILRCNAEIIRELKAKFFVPYANNDKITKASLIGFAQRLDMLFAEENTLGIQAIGTAGPPNASGLVAIDNRKNDNDTQALQGQIKELMQTIQNQRTTNYQNNKNQNTNQNNNNNNYNNNNMTKGACFNCGDPNHFVADCPTKPSRECFNCGNKGHVVRDCPRRNNNNNNYNRNGNNNRNNNNQNQGRYNNNGYNNRRSYNNNGYNNRNNNYNNNGYNNNNTINGNWANNQIKPWLNNVNEIRSMAIDLSSICAMHKEGDIREYVDTTLKPEEKHRSLLDTGAMVNAINEELVNRCGWKNEVNHDNAANIELANKHTVKSAGTIFMNVEIKGHKYKVEFRVVPDLTPLIIYGAPFLLETGILDEFRNSVNNHLGHTQTKNS